MADPVHPSVTRLLRAWSDGDDTALDQLVPLVEAELRRLARRYMARERRGHTLQTTALINEAFIRLVDARQVRWQDRAHFLGISARLMRRVLLDGAISKIVGDDRKRFVVKFVATIVGLGIAYFGHLGVLESLGYEVPAWIDYPLAALIIGGGTEGVNSILKFMWYAKEDKKSGVGIKRAATPDQQTATAKMGHQSMAKAT